CGRGWGLMPPPENYVGWLVGCRWGGFPPTPDTRHSPDMKLLIATKNLHKLNEIRAILDIPGLHLVCAMEFPHVPDVIEDGDSFEDNATKKAMSLAMATGLWSLADDSGLEVDILNGAPGVFSARYAGAPVSYSANNAKLLHELNGQSNRKARFRCAIALCSPKGLTRVVDGRCEGQIAPSVRGSRGFGYDPLFVPDGFTQTFAEMDPRTKNEISHRARALAKAREQWNAILARDLDDGPEGWHPIL
ncbi:MAG: RdgB/HAM1 family non-canonical purine NTP pyrophosphatase, partial [bacterium]